MVEDLRFLLLQVRNDDDPMRQHEIECFARSLECSIQQIRIFDLLKGAPTQHLIDDVDVVLLGGSGDYSVARGGPWLLRLVLADPVWWCCIDDSRSASFLRILVVRPRASRARSRASRASRRPD